MSKQGHPRHHPLNGQECIQVHDHDVLSGRGVNIAQHPGNERFRALVNTRHDESYCESFTTREKRALAQEIIDHIQSLDPPGRFLKRNGKSHSNRGLAGPWEELSPKDVLKKTCQALRDCNRSDRSGYAAAVKVPEDVKQNTEERLKSGMSLKEYAAAAVARENPSPIPSAAAIPAAGTTPEPLQEESQDHSNPCQLKRSNEDISDEHGSTADRVVTSMENPAPWLKRQRTEDSLPRLKRDTSGSPQEATENLFADAGRHYPPAAGGTFAMSAVQATPTAPPHVPSVPVTNTPMLHPYHGSMYAGHADATEGSPQHPPEMPPSPSYHHLSREEAESSSMAAVPAPYSPSGWNDRHGYDEDIDDSAEPVPMSEWRNHPYGHDDGHADDMLRSAADAAAALINNSSSRGEFPLLDGDEITHGSSLNLNELE
mmetsp:Transcript_12280/g.21564  ORF Transcript_12280/g.21564 Transcript_12280/m.21564 type:complete len:429 (-) Transcript_12280:340-1626(-)